MRYFTQLKKEGLKPGYGTKKGQFHLKSDV